jgi:hypothetical protein
MFSGLPLVAVGGVFDLAARYMLPDASVCRKRFDCRDYGAVVDR